MTQLIAHNTTFFMPEGELVGPFRTVFNGYGSVVQSLEYTPLLCLSPEMARNDNETHSALVVSEQVGAFTDITWEVQTVAQLRVGPPNPWEVAWVVWRYQDPDNFHYIALKPNGLEYGIRHPSGAGGQLFVKTVNWSKPVTERYKVTVSTRGVGIEITVNDRVIVDGRIAARLDALIPAIGKVGVYTEDAEIVCRSLIVLP